MIRIRPLIFVLTLGVQFLISCSNGNEDTPEIPLISSSVNGYSLDSSLDQIPVDLKIELVFGSSIDQAALRNAISLTSSSADVPFDLSLSNANSKVILEASLAYDESYSFSVSRDVIGVDGGALSNALSISFTTVADEIIRSMAPCTGTTDCLQAIELDIDGTPAPFWVYANYPLDIENAIWEDLKRAIIVVHGQNRDADNYYEYLTSTLSGLDLNESTLLIAPWFRDTPETSSDEFYWTTSAWREGGNSNGNFNVSSFALVDSLIQILANKEHFPVMEQVTVTGHSSGAMFTHTYAAASSAEDIHTEFSFQYVVANSQYFYYPLEYRYNEETDVFYVPTDCSGYDQWPYGFSAHPNYITLSDQELFNSRFEERAVIYLLGNDTSNDSALNTTNCKATLLGSTRYQRGENMFAFMNTYFPNHAHSRVIVESIGHDGEGMYKSEEFKSWLSSSIN